MLILKVPGLRNVIVEEFYVLGKYVSNKFSEKYVSGHFSSKMSTNMFPKNGVGGNFGFGGRARKITPLIYPLIFKNFFGHETGRRGSYGNNSE